MGITTKNTHARSPRINFISSCCGIVSVAGLLFAMMGVSSRFFAKGGLIIMWALSLISLIASFYAKGWSKRIGLYSFVLVIATTLIAAAINPISKKRAIEQAQEQIKKMREIEKAANSAHRY